MTQIGKRFHGNFQKSVKSGDQPFGIKLETLTFAVLSQTMGVVTCGKEMKLVRSPGSYFKNITEEFSKGVLWTFGKKRIL